MSRGFPSMTALLGLLAIAGYQNRDKIAETLRRLGQSTPEVSPVREDNIGSCPPLGIVDTHQPFPPDCEQRRHDDGANEEPDQPEDLQPAENSNQCHQERQACSVADQRWPHEVITREHDRRAPIRTLPEPTIDCRR
jgi:hypothetical protein